MNSFLGILMIFGWFLLRFGIPLGLTVLICQFLHKLDARWQKEAEGRQETIKVSKLTALINCWLHHDCPEEQREQCSAYQQPEMPCWQHFRSTNGYLQNRCVGCAVFRNTPAPIYGDGLGVKTT